MDNQQPAAPAPTDAPQIAPVDAAQLAPPAPSLIPPPVQGDTNATLLPASEAPVEPALPPMAPEVGKVDSKLPTAASDTPILTHEANVQPISAPSPVAEQAPAPASTPEVDPAVAMNSIVDDISSVENILVTVSTNPSVDELSAALGLALIMDKLEKRSTAVYSGGTPPAITFLDPEKVFEDTADSLRDFIIALDKDKADHLRYKVDGDVVKIFITPYKTILTEKDLEFTQGEYNIELVIALGVTSDADLDKALDAQEKILHGAKIVTITNGDKPSTLGSTDWHDGQASSLSEMIVSIAEQVGGADVLDEQIATALLTGIVSATERFSNDKTNSNAMTMAAELMAAGANQQLIAAKLAEAHDLKPGRSFKNKARQMDGGELSSDGSELTIERDDDDSSSAAPKSLDATTDELEKLKNDLSATVGMAPVRPEEKVIDPPAAPFQSAVPNNLSNEEADQLELEKQLAGLTSAPASPSGTLADIEKGLDQAAEEAKLPEAPVFGIPTVPSDGSMPDFEDPAASAPIEPLSPALPPLPNLTPEAPAPEPPQIIMEHGGMAPTPQEVSPVNGMQQTVDEQQIVNPFNGPIGQGTSTPLTPTEGAGTPEIASILSGGAAPEIGHIQTSIPEPPAGLPPLPPLPADLGGATLPPPPPSPISFPMASAAPAGAGAVSGDVFGDTSGEPTSEPAAQPVESGPGQYKIPGMG